MSRFVLLVIAVAIGACIWLLSLRDPSPVPAAAGGDARSRARTETSQLAPPPDAATTARVAATPDEAAPANESSPTLMLRGRAVDPDGQPLAACEARLRVERAGAADPIPEQTIVTDDSGTFEFAIRHDDWTDTVTLRVAADGRVPRSGSWPRPAPGRTIDVGDVVMLTAIAVDGVMVDRQGRAVADAKAMFVYIPLADKHEVEAESMLTCRTDRDGRFTFAAPAHVGEWYVGAEDTGPLLEPRSVKLGPELARYQLRIVVERPDPQYTIRGRCVDPAGQPLPGLRLSGQGEGFIGRGRSGTDGSFRVQRAGPVPDRGQTGVALSCSDPERRYELAEQRPAGRIAWGADGVTFVMRPLGRQSVRVIDAQGLPVTDYTLLAFRGERRLMHSERATQRGHHPDGRCELTGLNSGEYTFVVVPRAARLGASEPVPLTVEPGVVGRERIVTLHERVAVDIDVVGADGDAMAASAVELVLTLGRAGPPPVTADQLPALRDVDRARRTPQHCVVASGTTDAAGRVTLSAPRGTFHVRCRGAQHVPLVQQVQVVPPRARARCVVQSAAQLHGTLQPPAALARLQELALGGEEPVAVIVTPADGEPLPATVPDEHGDYRVGGLPTGRYAVALRYWLRTGDVREGSVTMPITELDLLAGAPRELPIDVAGMLPGTVRGRVVAGGEPLRDVHCFLRRTGPGKSVSLRVATDADGRYRGLVPPGDYGFAITYPAQPGPGWLHMVLPDAWQLQAGGEHVADFDVPLRRIRVQLQDEDGQPLPDVRARVRRTGYFLPGGLKTDDDGWLEIYPAPLDAFELREVDGSDRDFGPVDLPPGRIEGEVRVRARAG